MALPLRRPAILDEPATVGAHLLLRYIDDRLHDGVSPFFSGSRFESFLAPTDPFQITAEDVLSVSLLGVHYPGSAALRLLGEPQPTISTYLRAIPTELDLADAQDDIVVWMSESQRPTP